MDELHVCVLIDIDEMDDAERDERGGGIRSSFTLDDDSIASSAWWHGVSDCSSFEAECIRECWSVPLFDDKQPCAAMIGRGTVLCGDPGIGAPAGVGGGTTDWTIEKAIGGYFSGMEWAVTAVGRMTKNASCGHARR
jgi:hypothetical protein